ncbi:MAG TPA: hypothetical protein VIY08_01860 [Candidatus Nitrosocosmicus sp.]
MSHSSHVTRRPSQSDSFDSEYRALIADSIRSRRMLQSSFHLYSSEESVSHNIFKMFEYFQNQISRFRHLFDIVVRGRIDLLSISNSPSSISRRRNSCSF